MPFAIRKIVVFKETTYEEGNKILAKPITMLAVAAVIRNPWAGRGFVEDLVPEQKEGCEGLGRTMVKQVLAELKKEEIECYGKAAVVGAAGEVEHASAVIHTLRFGNQRRVGCGKLSNLHKQKRRPRELYSDPDETPARRVCTVALHHPRIRDSRCT